MPSQTTLQPDSQYRRSMARQSDGRADRVPCHLGTVNGRPDVRQRIPPRKAVSLQLEVKTQCVVKLYHDIRGGVPEDRAQPLDGD